MSAPPTAGERWTRDQLERLRARRFSPAAVTRFLVDSHLRSVGVRRDRPRLARQAHRWSATGAIAWAVPAALGLQPFRRRWRSGLAWWAACAVMLDWHLGMVETADGRPRDLGPPDALTLLRAWLAPVALHSPAPSVIVLAAATDALDGPLARRSAPTRAGRDLEGLADMSFAVAALRGAYRRGLLAGPVVAAEVARQAGGTAYALWTYCRHAHPPDARVLRAARAMTGVRTAGLLLASAGRRREAHALLLAASGLSLALVAWAVAAEEN